MIYGPKIVTSGLILALDAGDKASYSGTGATWNDLSGNGNHATIYNSPTWNAAGYFVLNGTNNYINTTNALNLSSYNKVTVVITFKPNTYPGSGTPKCLFELTNNFNNFSTGFTSFYNDNSGVGSGAVFDISTAIKGNVGYNIGYWNKSNYNDLGWKNVTYLFDTSQSSTESLLYVQGSSATATENPNPSYASNNSNNFANDNFYVGARGGSSYFNDINLSSVLIYNKVLTNAEISQNYNASKGRFGI